MKVPSGNIGNDKRLTELALPCNLFKCLILLSNGCENLML